MAIWNIRHTMDFVTKSMKPTRRVDFEAILPSIKFDILEYISRQNLPQEVTAKFEKVHWSSISKISVQEVQIDWFSIDSAWSITYKVESWIGDSQSQILAAFSWDEHLMIKNSKPLLHWDGWQRSFKHSSWSTTTSWITPSLDGVNPAGFDSQM